jgi:hypothetical protein
MMQNAAESTSDPALFAWWTRITDQKWGLWMVWSKNAAPPQLANAANPGIDWRRSGD